MSLMQAVTSIVWYLVYTRGFLLRVIWLEVEADQPVGTAKVENSRIIPSTTPLRPNSVVHERADTDWFTISACFSA